MNATQAMSYLINQHGIVGALIVDVEEIETKFGPATLVTYTLNGEQDTAIIYAD